MRDSRILHIARFAQSLSAAVCSSSLLFSGALACSANHHADPAARSDHADHTDHADHADHDTVTLTAEVIAAAGITSTPVERRVLAPVLEAVGVLEADPQRTYEIAARVQGVVHGIQVREGEWVDAGAPLLTIRAPKLGGVRADLSSLRARAAAANANLERLEILASKRLVSHQEVAAARAEAAALAAENRAASQRLRALSAGTKGSGTEFTLTAPSPGILTHLAVRDGEAVTEEETVATIINLEQAWFMARIFEHTLEQIEVGAAAEVVLNALPSRPLLGVVDLLSPTVDPSTRTVTARIIVDNPEGALRLGLFGRARIARRGATSAPVLAIPRAARLEIDGEDTVFVDRGDGRYEHRRIRVGAAAPGTLEILDGLEIGERVVDAGAWSLKSVLLRERFAADDD